MFNKKIEVISFKEFLNPTVTQKKIPHNNILFSLVPSMTLESFFQMSPEITTAYVIVLGVGGFAILSHFIEVMTAKSDLSYISYIIEKFTRIALPVGTYGFMLWVLFQII